jgi:hypothetical protein
VGSLRDLPAGRQVGYNPQSSKKVLKDTIIIEAAIIKIKKHYNLPVKQRNCNA